MHATGSVKPEPPEPRTGLWLQGTLIALALSARTAWVGPSSSPPPSAQTTSGPISACPEDIKGQFGNYFFPQHNQIISLNSFLR